LVGKGHFICLLASKACLVDGLLIDEDGLHGQAQQANLKDHEDIHPNFKEGVVIWCVVHFTQGH